MYLDGIPYADTLKPLSRWDEYGAPASQVRRADGPHPRDPGRLPRDPDTVGAPAAHGFSAQLPARPDAHPGRTELGRDRLRQIGLRHRTARPADRHRVPRQGPRAAPGPGDAGGPARGD